MFKDIHPELQKFPRQLLIGVLLGTLAAMIFFAGAAAIMFQGELTRMIAKNPLLPLVVIIFPLPMMIGPLFLVYFLARSYRRLTWLLENVKPTSQQIVIRAEGEGKNRQYLVELSAPQTGKLRVSRVSWDLNQYLNRTFSAELYLDPESDQRAVLRTESGLLWCLPKGLI